MLERMPPRELYETCNSSSKTILYDCFVSVIVLVLPEILFYVTVVTFDSASLDLNESSSMILLDANEYFRKTEIVVACDSVWKSSGSAARKSSCS